MMLVCVKCKSEMICEKTGRPLVWRKSHVYAGDEYKCKTCGMSVVYTNSTAYHLERALEVLEEKNPIDMDKE